MAFGAFAPPPLRNLGPVLTPFPKAATNIAGVPVSAQREPTMAETLLQLAQMMDVGSQNQLRQLQGKQIQQKMEMTPQLMNFITKFGGGAAGAAAGTAGQPDATTAQPAVYGSLAPATPSAAGSSGLLASPKDSGVAGSQVFQALKSMGASDNEAALLTSAAQSESSFNPNITHDGGIGYGLFGHNGDRLDAMRASAGVGPGLPVPMDAQLKFALNELRNRPEGAAVNSVTTPEGLTDLQMQFERPNRNINNGNYDQRLAATRQYMGLAGGGPVQVAQNVSQRSAAPVYGSLAPGAAPGTASPSIDPLDIAKAGAMSEVLGFPNIFKPFGEYYYNSPGYIAQKAGAEKAGAYPWAGPTAAAEANARQQAEAQYAAQIAASRASGEIGAKLNAPNLFPAGSPQQGLAQAYAANAAGIKPLIGGEQAGVPIRRFNPITGGMDIIGQNPAVEKGQIFTGSRIENVPGSTAATTESESAKEFGQNVGQANAKDFFARRGAALDAAKSLDASTTARGLLDSGAITGTGAAWRLSAARALATAGLTSGADVANTEAYVASRAQEVGRIIKLFGSGTGLSDADRQYAEKAAAGKVELTEQSLRKILDINDRAARNIINLFNSDAQKVSPALSPYPLTVPMPTAGAAQNAPARLTNKAEFDKLPSGAVYIAPDGTTRRKP